MSSNEIKKNYRIKTVLLGESGVGKSCIILRYINDIFSFNHVSTILSTYSSKTIIINNTEITFDIWDTAGQEKFRSIAKINYKDAAVVILVLDITSNYSFQSIKDYWYPQIKQNAPENAIIALVIAKCDIKENQEVDPDEVENYASSIDALFKLTSSLENTGINELFEEIGKKILSVDNFLGTIIERSKTKLTSKMDEDSTELFSENTTEKKKIDNKNSKKKKDRCC